MFLTSDIYRVHLVNQVSFRCVCLVRAYDRERETETETEEGRKEKERREAANSLLEVHRARGRSRKPVASWFINSSSSEIRRQGKVELSGRRRVYSTDGYAHYRAG